MPNGRCRMHGGKSPGAPKGNKNALKHGRYTADAIAKRREIATLLRAMKMLTRAAGEGESASLGTTTGTSRGALAPQWGSKMKF